VADVIGSQAATSVRVGVADPVAAQHILTESGFVVRQEGELLVVEGVIDGAEVTKSLASRGLYLNELIPVRADLESVFLELTADEGLETVGVTR
jgi:ABC-2 type transport system ATP-binding protein